MSIRKIKSPEKKRARYDEKEKNYLFEPEGIESMHAINDKCMPSVDMKENDTLLFPVIPYTINNAASSGHETPSSKSPTNRRLCLYCEKRPFFVLQYEEELAKKIKQLNADESYSIEPNACRKQFYIFCSNLLHGRLGKGNREKLPDCVVTVARKNWPSTNGQYMGFKAS